MRNIFIIASILLLLYSCKSEDDVAKDTSNNTNTEISPNYVNIDWATNKVYSCDTISGTYVISNSSQTENIKSGNVIVLDADTTGYIVLVSDVRKENDKLVINGTQGGLCDVFANTSFTLTTDYTQRSSRAVNSPNVYYPTQIIYSGDNGRSVSKPLTRNEEEMHLTGDLWNWDTPKLTDEERTLYKDKNTKVYIKEASSSIDIDLSMDLNFGGWNEIQIVQSALRQYRSNALDVKAYVNGTVSNEYVVQADVEGSVTYREKEDELVKHNLLKPISVKFIVNGVPVYVVLSANMLRGASIEANGKLSAYAGVESEINVQAGLEWEQESGLSPIENFNQTTELIPPTAEGKGSITAKAWMYPRIFVTLYNTIGPSFDIIPYIGSEIEGGFGKDLTNNSENDYCAYTLRNFWGVDFNAGLSLKFMNYEVEHYDIGRVNAFENDLYKSPVKIILSSSSIEKPQVGKPIECEFEVYDNNCLLNQEAITPLPQIVKFMAEGNLSDTYAITNNGTVKVTWTPKNSSDELKAILYNADGSIIDECSFGEPSLPEPTEGNAIDLGLSVLWSSTNLGANSPEDFGEYYAWGETSTKSKYTNNNYMYYHPKSTTDGKIYESEYDDIGYDISGTEYDAVHISKGGKWRTPTLKEVQELIDDCEHFSYTYKGTKGFLFVGSTGNAIFIPLSGYFNAYWAEGSDGDICYYEASCLSYWTSTLVPNYWPVAYILVLDGLYDIRSDGQRMDGRTIRPVRDK